MSDMFFCRWYCERFISSPDRQQMGLAGTAIYGLLLMHQFLLGEDGLPANERQLRGLVGFHTDAEWSEYWPLVRIKFVERDGRLFNDVMLEEYRRARAVSEAAKTNGKKGGRPRKKNPEVNPEVNPELTQGLSYPPSTIHHPPPNSHKPSPTRARGAGQLTATGEVLSSTLEDFTSVGPNPENQLAELVGEESCRKWGLFYRWAFDNHPNLAADLVKHIVESQDERQRELKGIAMVEEPGPWFFHQMDMRTDAPTMLELRRASASAKRAAQ